MFQKLLCPPWCKIQVYLLCRSKTCTKQATKGLKYVNLLNIYFMCNVSFRLKQKLERVVIGGGGWGGGCRDNLPFRYCTHSSNDFCVLRKRRVVLPLNCPDIVGHCLCQPLSLQLSYSVSANCSYMVRCQNTLKIYDVKSKDNHKLRTHVVVHLLKVTCMYEYKN